MNSLIFVESHARAGGHPSGMLAQTATLMGFRVRGSDGVYLPSAADWKQGFSKVAICVVLSGSNGRHIRHRQQVKAYNLHCRAGASEASRFAQGREMLRRPSRRSASDTKNDC